MEQSVNEWYVAEVKDRMKDAGLRPYHMAYRCQIKHDNVYQYLNGTVMPDPWRLVLMAECFDCCVNELLGYDDVEDVGVFEIHRASEMFADKQQYAICFADRLNRYLDERGLSPEDISTRTGVSNETVKRWISNRPSLPRFSHFIRLVDALKCTPSDLLGY